MSKGIVGLVVLLVFGAIVYVGTSGMLSRNANNQNAAHNDDHVGDQFSHNTLHVTADSFETDVLQNKQVVLVDFWAPWCGPCLEQGPTIEELAIEYDGQAVIAKVNVDEAGSIAQKYNITGIPSLLYFKNGEVVETQVGVQSHRAIADKLDELIDY